MSVASGSLGGWEQEIPSGDSPCWVIQATAVSTEATDTMSSSEFSSPVKLVEDGDKGDSIYTAMVYKESDSKPATPTGTTVPPTGWDVTMPSSGDTPITPSYDSNFITSGGKKRLKSIYDNGNIWGKVSFTANAGDVIKVAIRASSEANYDFGFLSPLDSEAHSTSTYKARVSGTQTAEVEYAIPAAGTHFFCVGYVKDSSQSSGDDTVYV